MKLKCDVLFSRTSFFLEKMSGFHLFQTGRLAGDSGKKCSVVDAVVLSGSGDKLLLLLWRGGVVEVTIAFF